MCHVFQTVAAYNLTTTYNINTCITCLKLSLHMMAMSKSCERNALLSGRCRWDGSLFPICARPGIEL